MSTAEFSKCAGILSEALSQHHILGFEIAQLEFHHLLNKHLLSVEFIEIFPLSLLILVFCTLFFLISFDRFINFIIF